MEARKKKVGVDLTEGSVMKLLLTFAVPMVLAQLLQQLYSAVDLMVIGKFVGNIGTVGVSTGSEISDYATTFAMSIAMGAQVYISQLAGAKDKENLKEAIGTMLTLLFGVAIFLLVAVLIFHNAFLRLLNCPEEAWTEAARYMMITALGLPFVFGYNGISAMLRGMGESKKPLLFIAISATVNIFADILFVVVIPLQAAGTAIATVLSQIGSFVAAFIYMYKHRSSFDFKLKLSYFHINTNALRRIMRMAIPQLIRTSCVHLSMLWVKSQINTFGMVASSTYSIGNKVEKFMNVFVAGVDGAASAMIGQNLGARKLDRVNRVLWCTLLCNLISVSFVITAFLTIPDTLYGFFTNEPEVIEFGRTFLQIMSVGMVVMAFAGCFKSIATGSGAALLALTLGIMDGVCRILACLIFKYVFHQGAQSYFWGAAFCMLVPGIMSFVYFLSGRWKKKKLLSET